MGHGARSRSVVSALLAILVVSGCSDHKPTAQGEPAPGPTAAPSYDATLEPSAAVLALVPGDTQTLTVTDFDQVREDLAMDELDGHSTPADVAAFWERAHQERPLLSPGMLRPDDAQLVGTYGFSAVDVSWEAHLYDATDHETGWVVAFRDGTDMAQVARATQDPQTPLSGGAVDETERLVSSGTTADPGTSWAADPDLEALVGLPANSTYVSRGCGPDAASADVDDLAAYSVQFEGSLVTARLGEGRQDLFTRLRLADSQPAFAAVYAGGVADPATGRLGFEMPDPVQAAQLALQHRLPFAACAPDQGSS